MSMFLTSSKGLFVLFCLPKDVWRLMREHTESSMFVEERFRDVKLMSWA